MRIISSQPAVPVQLRLSYASDDICFVECEELLDST